VNTKSKHILLGQYLKIFLIITWYLCADRLLRVQPRTWYLCQVPLIFMRVILHTTT
jgi:hypothetical protein